MASLPIPVTKTLVPRHAVQARRAALPSAPRYASFPNTWWGPWLLSFLFALPYLTIVLVTAVAGVDQGSTPNAQLLERVARVDWGNTDFRSLAVLFPPLTSLIAAVVPGGPVGLSVAGALLGGILLQKAMEVMVQRRYSVHLIVILLLALGANPLFAYTAIENYEGFAGLILFGLAISEIIRFVAWGHTRSGFRAGMLLLLAVLSDQTAPLYLATAAIATPFLTLGRYRGRPGVRRAQVLVVVFPAAAAIVTLTLISYVFTGDPLSVVGSERFIGTGARFIAIGALFTTLSGALLALPVLAAWLIAAITRRPGALVVSTLVLAAILTASGVGLLSPASAGNTFILLMLLAISLLPSVAHGLRAVLITAIGVGQIVIAWVTAFDRDVVVEWMSAVASAFGAS